MILAPGASVLEQENAIRDYIEKENPIIIAANFQPEHIKADYVFCCNAMRFEMLQKKPCNSNLIVTSNLLDMCSGSENVVNYSELSFDEEGNCDNSVIMLFKLLLKLDAPNAAVAGFDGYQINGKNYVKDYMANKHTKGEAENIRIKKYMKQIKQKMQINYLTKSLYQD